VVKILIPNNAGFIFPGATILLPNNNNGIFRTPGNQKSTVNPYPPTRTPTYFISISLIGIFAWLKAM